MTDIIDAQFEAAIFRYQAKLGLGITCKLDFDTTEGFVFAYIKIGSYSEDHRDGEPFDGVSGVSAHSFGIPGCP
ncbi:hypothetical protein SADUNF_Sadunf02G0119800 [Salix dunnii]|uniref:Uncharacterized protein n=1 Tax=Salix dunnii TaxID=1413687 RepID=A0A835N7J3_9ROSI|nr:hypothetical protein SADUNF_Sadunf02G0119800 [Salix dunnii]